MRGVCCGVGAALIAALFPALLVVPAASAPVPTPPPAIRLKPAGEVQVPDLFVHAATVIDGATVALVGMKAGPEEADPDTLAPNGAIIDLATKAIQPFSNGHTARICGVAAGRGRIVTVSTNKD